MIKSAAIIPTGDEILNGIVMDTDSPAIIGEIIKVFPECTVTRFKPLKDDETEIVKKIDECVKNNYELIILIGGSGGGHRYCESSSRDYTHTAMENYLDIKESNNIYGKNGHLWCRLIAGKKDNSIVINVPGPYVEAVAAAKNYINTLKFSNDLRKIVDAAANGVLDIYKSGGVV